MVSPGRHCHYLEEQALPRTRGYALSDRHERTERRSAPRQPTAILAIILVSYFMILLDNSIIFTALPTIHTAMHYSATGLAWVQDAYTLVFGGLLLLGARAGDLLAAGGCSSSASRCSRFASLLVGMAPAGWWLIGARAVQADWVSWRAGFFLNVPIGMAMILLAPAICLRRAAGRDDST